MSDDVVVKNGIIIPSHELEITASRASGPGGQHVNKTSSRISVRWNVKNSAALTEEQKILVMEKLASEITQKGDIIVHCSESRSQHANRKEALLHLAQKINKALQVPKKRMKSKVSKEAKEKRVQEKRKHAVLKKLRKVTFD